MFLKRIIFNIDLLDLFLQNTNTLPIKQTNVISTKLLISSCYDIYEGSFGSHYNFLVHLLGQRVAILLLQQPFPVCWHLLEQCVPRQTQAIEESVSCG